MKRWLYFITSSAALAGCVSSSSVPATPTPTSSLTPTPTLTETPTATPTITPTATSEKIVTILEVLERAESRELEFSYLQSEEFLNALIEKDLEGKNPLVPLNPNYIKPGRMTLRFDKTELSPIFRDYFTESAINFLDSSRWSLDEDKPYALVDAGFTEREGVRVGFFVVKWGNPEGEEPAFWGFTFVPQGELSTEEFWFWYDLNGKGYPMPAHFLSVEGCQSYFKRITGKDVSEYCNDVGTNPDLALPKESIRKWNETGVLHLHFLPWSQAMPSPITRAR